MTAIMRRLVRTLLVSTCCVAMGCGDSEVKLARGPLTLSVQPVVLRTRAALPFRSPDNELCLKADTSFLDPDRRTGAVRKSDGSWIVVHAALIDESGRRRQLGFNMSTASGSLCSHMEPDSSAQYVAVELAADKPITVSDVRWWSGRRLALP
jgi:hypothetical protein